MAHMLAEAAAAFEETLDSLGISDSTSDLGDPAELGRRAALLVASEYAWGQHLGPLLDGQQVRQLLGVRTRQAVHDLVRRRRLLGLPTAEGHLVFPAMQFAPDGRPYAALPAILESFAQAIESPQTIGSWLASPQPILDGRTPAAWLRAGRDSDRVIEAARRAAARLSQQPSPLSPLALPAGSLTGFPSRQFEPGTPLFRIHRRDRAPWWFSRDGSGRFDLTPPRGTCYLAEVPLGAFIEVFRSTVLVPEVEVNARHLSLLGLDRHRVVADSTARRARAFGTTAAIHSGQVYHLTQAWAQAFAAAGFDGVRYLLSHDPAQRCVGIALFGSAGLADWPASESRPIDLDLIRAARRTFGIRVIPSPSSR